VIRTLALAGLGPAQVLAKANPLVTADSGDSAMFVTVFYAELEPATGRLIYANAGHNPALVLRAEGKVEELIRTGIPLGVLPACAFLERELILEPGEEVLLYTDGVTEAPDPKGTEFGLARLRDLALGALPTSAAEQVAKLRQAVFSFAGDQPQFDDLTLMVIKRLKAADVTGRIKEAGKMKDQAEALHLKLTANLEALAEVAVFLARAAEALAIPEKAFRALELVADEAVTNVVSYAYPPEKPGPVRLSVRREGPWVRLIIEDEGRPFELNSVRPPDLDAPLQERRIGGLGVYFMEKMMDVVERTREGEVNRLVLSKRI